MNLHEIDAPKHHSTHTNKIGHLIKLAIEKSTHGRYIVATSQAGEVLVLPHFNASTRKDLTWVYDTEFGYVFSTKRSA